MNTIVKSLKALTTHLGGTDTTSKTVVDALKKVFGAYGGTGSTAKTISGCIDEIATVAVPTPTGKLSITGTSEVNCASYATAQVSDADLVAENIKKDVNILGVTGSYEGGGGSSDFSTATVTINSTYGGAGLPPTYVVQNLVAVIPNEEVPVQNYVQFMFPDFDGEYTVLLYKGVTYAWFETSATITNIVGTGGVSVDNTGETPILIITGDGTLSFDIEYV